MHKSGICIYCGKETSRYWFTKCRSCSHKGIKGYWLGKKILITAKNKMSISHKGIHPINEFRKGHNCLKYIKCDYYKNIWMRSSYEIKYAKYLDSKNTKWIYESKTFDLGNTTYTPDFYLPKTDEYIEIKGWWRDDAKEKFNIFRNKYNKIKIKVLMKEDLIKIGVL